MRSLTGVHLFALDKSTFLEVVTGHPATVTEATAITGEWLATAAADTEEAKA